jgi:hypothetical protein
MTDKVKHERKLLDILDKQIGNYLKQGGKFTKEDVDSFQDEMEEFWGFPKHMLFGYEKKSEENK